MQTAEPTAGGDRPERIGPPPERAAADLETLKSGLVWAERFELFNGGLTFLGGVTLAALALLLAFDEPMREWLPWGWFAAVGLVVAAEFVLPRVWRRTRKDLQLSDLAYWRGGGAFLALVAGGATGVVLAYLLGLAPSGLGPPALTLVAMVVMANLAVWAATDLFLLTYLLGCAAPPLWRLLTSGTELTPGRLVIDGSVFLLILVLGIGFAAASGRIALLRAVSRNTAEKLRLAREEIEGLRGELSVRNEQQERVEHQLYLAKEAAENANLVKSEFLATMSHEIRTPLNGIVPLLEILQESPLDGEQYQHVTTALDSSHHLLSIINDILDFSKIEAGKLELESIEMDVRELVDSVNTLLRGNAERRGISLGYSIDEGVPRWVRGDPIRLRQILTNLVSNAIKFTQQGGVEVLVSRRDRQGTEIEMLFAVKDSGVGMNPETVGKLFRSFTQADASTTRKHGGTGLGLVISKRLVEMMGGRIGVRSEEGEGSIFWFNIPVRKSLWDTPPSRTSLQGVRALLVGEPAVLEAGLQPMLGRLGIECDQAGTFRQAVEGWRALTAADEPACDLVIVDGASLGSKAPFFLQAVSTQPAASRLPVVLVGGDRQVGGVFGERPYALFIADSPGLPELTRALFRVLDVVPDGNTPVGGGAGEGGDEGVPTAPVEPRRPGRAATTQLAGRVLLVEDNATNAAVAGKLLERLGLECDAVTDGVEAVEATDMEPYDVVLMDCQMPRMDGYRATAVIREREQKRGLNRVPVIAMTANAMVGDRERCLAAGMDDYVSKPLIPGELQSTLRQWLPMKEMLPEVALPGAGDDEESGGAVNDDASVSAEALDDLYRVMQEEFTDLLGAYLESATQLVEDVDGHLAAADLEAVVLPAHSLKSSSANVGALRLSALAEAVEAAARGGDLEAAKTGWRPVPAEFMRVQLELEPVMARGRPSAA